MTNSKRCNKKSLEVYRNATIWHVDMSERKIRIKMVFPRVVRINDGYMLAPNSWSVLTSSSSCRHNIGQDFTKSFWGRIYEFGGRSFSIRHIRRIIQVADHFGRGHQKLISHIGPEHFLLLYKSLLEQLRYRTQEKQKDV